MNEKTNLIKNASLIAIGNFGAKMISFLLLPLYTSLLSTKAYGTYDFIVAISAFLLPIVTVSMHEGMFRFIIDTGEKGEKFKKVVTNSFFVVLLGIFLLAIVLFLLNIFIPNLNNLMFIFIYVAVNSLYTFSNNLLRGLGKIKQYTIISSVKNTMQLILNIVCIVVFKFGVLGLIVSFCISELISVLVILFVSKIWNVVNFKYICFKELKPLLKYSVPLIPNSLGAQIINVSDRIIISIFIGASENGIYSVSYKFPNVIETIYHFFYMAWSESASRVFQKGISKAKEYYQSLYNLIERFMFSVILLMISAMPILFRIFIKGNYVNGFLYVPILLLAMYFDCIAKFYSGIYSALKKTKIMAISTIIAALLNIIINVLLIKKLGLFAAAISTLIAEIVLVIIRRRFIMKDIEINIKYKNMLISFGVLIVILFLYDYNNVVKIISSIFIAGIYFLIVNYRIIKIMYKKIFKKISKGKI